MIKSKEITVIVLLMFLSFGCKKDDPRPSKTDLISKTWKIIAYNFDGADAFHTLGSCGQDDRFIFTKDGHYTEDEGATKCNDLDPQIALSGRWSFQENETKLKIEYVDGHIETYTLYELTKDKLKIILYETVTNGTAIITSTFTFSPVQ